MVAAVSNPYPDCYYCDPVLWIAVVLFFIPILLDFGILQSTFRWATEGKSNKRAVITLLRIVGPILLGVGAFLMSFGVFWLGIFFLLGALLVVIIDVVLEQNLSRVIKLCCVILGMLSILAVYKYIISPPAPLMMHGASKISDYPDGTDVSGIAWRSGMSELTIYIDNSSSQDISQLSILFQPQLCSSRDNCYNEVVRAVTQVTNIPNCYFVVGDPTLNLDVSAREIRKSGIVHGVYMAKGPTNYGFTMHCESKLPANDHIELEVAMGHAKVRPQGNGILNLFGNPAETSADVIDFWGPSTIVTQVHARGSYSSFLGKPHHFNSGFKVVP
jgi:hypothetical protein